ncbi:MAG: hypothetical protein ABI402_10325 [Ferruginibacter sp.]
MKKITTYLLILPLLAVLLMSCSKTADEATWEKYGIKDFIEFKIDGQSYRMEEEGSGNSDFISSVANQSRPQESQYALQISFTHAVTTESMAISVFDYAVINQFHYNISAGDHRIFTYTMPDGNQYRLSNSSYGSIDFSNIDITLNHRVEATCQMTNIGLVDKEGNVISSGHVLTGGRTRANI